MINNIKAIFWDYDGTLVDTREKNLNVTRKIIQKITGINPENFAVLQTLEVYDIANNNSTNWRELYRKELGLTEKQTDEAGRLWTEYQLNDNAPTPFFSGIREVLRSLSSLPQGIISQNSQSNIRKVLKDNRLLGYFDFIVGYEEVELRKQKPEPGGILMSINKLPAGGPRFILYVGDHETDVICALNANNILSAQGSGIQILTIGAFYSSKTEKSSWTVKPDFSAKQVMDIIKIVRSFKQVSQNFS